MPKPDAAGKSWCSEELAALTQAIPFFATRILLAPAGRGELGRLLKRRPGVAVYGLESGPERARIAELSLDAVAQCQPVKAFGEASCDLCVFLEPPDKSEFETVAPCLDRFGCVYALLPGSDDPDALHPEAQAFADMATSAGWPTYRRIPLDTGQILLVCIHHAYNPLEHAHHKFDAGQPESCYEILNLIPDAYLETPAVVATVCGERALSLLAWLKKNPHLDPLEAFVKAQQLFYRVVAEAPDHAQSYQVHAEFWRFLGDTAMAGRILKSFQHVYPHPEVTRQLNLLPPAPELRRGTTAPAHPEAYAPRVLFVTHPRFHYGLDVLYDGLCTVLGDGRVGEYPFKPSLHGAVPEHMRHYPCRFDRPGTPATLEEILGRLRAGAFDIVLWGDCEEGIPREEARQIAEAASKTPVFILDQIDEPLTIRERLNTYTGGLNEAGYFKREFLACAEHGPNSFPLPFAYADNRVPDWPDGPREVPVFWAGHRLYGMRRLYLEHMERRFDLKLDEVFDQETYAARLCQSRIGLNLFGAGFDTVRYWEVPAHGCLLFSERLPIHIPHDFVDGESAVFFRDTAELEEKLEYYLDHPDEAAAIAARGYQHFLRHHTGSARARQLLGWVHATLS